MWHDLTSDQDLLRDTTARYLDKHAALNIQRKTRGSSGEDDLSYWVHGAELGWTSLLVAESDGGGSVSGRGAVDLALVAYEFGRHAAPGPLVDCNVAAAALSGSSKSLHRTAFEGLLNGTVIVSSCLGAAPWQAPGDPGLRISRDGGGVIVSGTVRPVEAAAQASYLLVTGRSTGGLTQILLPASHAGIIVTPLRSIDVSRRFCDVSFQNVRAPSDAILGVFGAADEQVAMQIGNAAVILAAEQVGALDAAFGMTLDYAFQRYTFGRALASYQALKHRFADLKSWLEASHAISDAAAEAIADRAPLALEMASAARAYIGQYGTELVQDCVQLHGGIGVTYDHDLHFFLRRVTINSLLFGTTAHHRRLLAAAQLEREIARD